MQAKSFLPKFAVIGALLAAFLVALPSGVAFAAEGSSHHSTSSPTYLGKSREPIQNMLLSHQYSYHFTFTVRPYGGPNPYTTGGGCVLWNHNNAELTFEPCISANSLGQIVPDAYLAPVSGFGDTSWWQSCSLAIQAFTVVGGNRESMVSDNSNIPCLYGLQHNESLHYNGIDFWPTAGTTYETWVIVTTKSDGESFHLVDQGESQTIKD